MYYIKGMNDDAPTYQQQQSTNHDDDDNNINANALTCIQFWTSLCVYYMYSIQQQMKEVLGFILYINRAGGTSTSGVTAVTYYNATAYLADYVYPSVLSFFEK